MNVSKWLHNAGIAIGAGVTGFLVTVPDAAMQLWQSSPELFQTFIPEPYLPVVSGGLTTLVAISRIVQAKKAKKGGS